MSGSSAFSKLILYIWQFSIQILLKPSLKDFEHNLIISQTEEPGRLQSLGSQSQTVLSDFHFHFTSMGSEHNCLVVWIFFITALLGNWEENWYFPVVWPLDYPNMLTYWVEHIKVVIFRIWNSSAGIPSHLLALYLGMLPKTHLTSHSRMSGSRWVTTPWWLSGSLKPFLYSSSVCSCHLF